MQYVRRLDATLLEYRQLASDCLHAAVCGMKDRHDTKSKPVSYKVGDRVLVLTPVKGTSISPRFTGPYEVIEVPSALNIVVKTPSQPYSTRLVHVNRTKPYLERSIDSLALDAHSPTKLVAWSPIVAFTKENDIPSLFSNASGVVSKVPDRIVAEESWVYYVGSCEEEADEVGQAEEDLEKTEPPIVSAKNNSAFHHYGTVTE